MNVGVTYQPVRVSYAHDESIVTLYEPQLRLEQTSRIKLDQGVVHSDGIAQIGLANKTIVVRGVPYFLAWIRMTRIVGCKCPVFNFVECEKLNARHGNFGVNTAAKFIGQLHVDGRRVAGLEYCRELPQ